MNVPVSPLPSSLLEGENTVHCIIHPRKIFLKYKADLDTFAHRKNLGGGGKERVQVSGQMWSTIRAETKKKYRQNCAYNTVFGTKLLLGVKACTEKVRTRRGNHAPALIVAKSCPEKPSRCRFSFDDDVHTTLPSLSCWVRGQGSAQA